MVKKSEVTADTLGKEKDIEQILAENARLRQEKAEMEKTIATLGDVKIDPMAMKYMNEVAAIKKTGRVDTEKIKVKEITDHKNISLWTRWGKRIGPMHRDNALVTLNSFYQKGIMLSTQQPTKDEVDAWLASPEGKAWKDNVDKRRAVSLKTLKRGELEKILKVMSQQFGLTTEALMNLKKPGEVMSPVEGRKAIGA